MLSVMNNLWHLQLDMYLRVVSFVESIEDSHYSNLPILNPTLLFEFDILGN